VAARLMSEDRAFYGRGAAELEACSPIRRRVRGCGSHLSFLVLSWQWIYPWPVQCYGRSTTSLSRAAITCPLF